MKHSKGKIIIPIQRVQYQRLKMKKKKPTPIANPTCLMDKLHKKYSQANSAVLHQKNLQLINNIIQRQICPSSITVMDLEIWTGQREFLKRQYSIQQFGNKIQAITQHYRFQTNFPLEWDTPIQKIMKKYQGSLDRIKRKQVKKFMKENNLASISSVRTFSSSSNSPNSKSKYSTKLSRLNSNRTSFILEGICKEIGYGLKDIQTSNFYKGKFASKEGSFKKFIIREKMKEKQSKEVRKQFDSNKKVFQRKYKTKSMNLLKKVHPKSFSKTTANETVSRQETSKGFRRRKVKKSITKSLPKILPQIRPQAKINPFKKQTNQIVALFDKSLNYIKRRIMSGKILKENEDANKINKISSIERLSKIKQNFAKQKDRKSMKGFRPTSSTIKEGKSRSKLQQATEFADKKRINSLIRKKLKIR